MAMFAEEMEVHDELRLLGAGTDDAEEGPRRTGALRSRAAVALVALGLLGSALYLLAPSQQHTSAATSAGAVAGLQGKAEKKGDDKKRLIVEQDLGKFISVDKLPAKAKLSSIGGPSLLPEAADHTFQHVVSESGIDAELTDAELSAFKNRFISAMIDTQGANKWWVGDYVQTLQKTIEGTKPAMTKALAKSWNGRQSSFTVEMRDWMLDESQDSLNSRLGRTPLERTGKVAERTSDKNLGSTTRDVLPAAFDSREGWPECADVIGKIHNQGRCGSCWVFGAMGPLDSRICIKTNASFSGDTAMLSCGFGTSCATTGDGCGGGWEYFVFQYIEDHAGIPSSKCTPYFGGEDYADHWNSAMPAPPCPGQCDSRYTRDISQDWFKPSGVGAYRLVLHPDAQGILDMKSAIYEGGPIAMGIYANNVFMGYSGGIFDSECGGNANHAVQAIGWGEGYILGQNSWGPGWGLGGRFKVAHCVPTDFTVPGEIEVEDYPLPIPEATRTTTSTLPPPIASTLPCVTLADGCITSPNYPEAYGNSQHCDLPYSIGKISVEHFHVERGYDYIEVNGVHFTGSHGPQGVVPKTNLVWSSDSSVSSSGWKICPSNLDEESTVEEK